MKIDSRVLTPQPQLASAGLFETLVQIVPLRRVGKKRKTGWLGLCWSESVSSRGITLGLTHNSDPRHKS
jgi:hypothetical protein